MTWKQNFTEIMAFSGKKKTFLIEQTVDRWSDILLLGRKPVLTFILIWQTFEKKKKRRQLHAQIGPSSTDDSWILDFQV